MSQTGFVREEVLMNDRGIFSGSYSEYELYTAYQPIVDVQPSTEKHVFGYEGLIRCKGGQDFTPPPLFFADVPAKDRFYIERLCHELHIKNWQVQTDPKAALFINVDIRLLDEKRLDHKGVALAISKAQLWGIDPELLVCEVIESEAQSLRALKYFADCLKDFGVRIAVDDFGVDYSNIDRVRLLKPDFVKLDGMFFHRFATNGRLLPMLTGLVERLRDQGAEIIAEAVETEHHRDTALDCGISLMQGYYLGRPEVLD